LADRENKSGYQTVNSVQRLQEIKAFVRMSSGLDLGEYGWNGGGTKGNRHRAELLASMPGIVQEENGELHFAEWNCRAGQHHLMIRTDGNCCSVLFDVWGNLRLGKY
jgi:hypothetical protein